MKLTWLSFSGQSKQDCDTSYVEVYDPTTAASDRKDKICGSKTKAITSVSNHMYLRLYAITDVYVKQFEALFTVFSKGVQICLFRNIIQNMSI